VPSVIRLYVAATGGGNMMYDLVDEQVEKDCAGWLER